MADIDGRLLRVGLEVENEIRLFDTIPITVEGTKFGNPNQGECNVTLTNLEKEIRDYILTETSPFNRNPVNKTLTVEAGRESTGYSLLYVGNIFRSGISQPPDQTIRIKCLTSQFQKSNIVVNSLPGNRPLSEIAEQVARDSGLTLVYQAVEKIINGYSFEGSALKQIERLAEIAGAGINVYNDNDQLIIKDNNTALQNRIRIVGPDSGMVGIPEPTDRGLKVRMMYDNITTVGSMLEVRTAQYPAYSGRYVVYKLGYHLANRDTPFYLTADTRRAND